MLRSNHLRTFWGLVLLRNSPPTGEVPALARRRFLRHPYRVSRRSVLTFAELAASRAECLSLRKNVDEEKEVVAAVSRQLVEFRERFGSALPTRDGAAAAAAAAMAAARRATQTVVLEALSAPSVDGDQVSLYSAAMSPRAGGNFIVINVDDLLVAVGMQRSRW